jgi:hypothetical protein
LEQEEEMDLYDIVELLGYLLRVLGSLVFGLGVGWLTIRTLTAAEGNWQLAIAVFLGILATFVLIGNWVAGGATLGAFGLGAGAGLLIWGLGIGKGKDA